MENEYNQYTLPLDDTIPLGSDGSPVPKSGSLNLGMDNEALAIPDSLDDFEAQTEEDDVKQVVLDSDEEREHINEVNGASLRTNDSSSRGLVKSSLKRQLNNSGYLRRLSHRVSAHPSQHDGSARRTGCDEKSDDVPASLDIGTRYQEPPIFVNSITSSTANQKPILMDGKECYHQELRNMSRGCLREDVLDEKKLSSDKSLEMEKDVIDKHSARFNCVESPEPGEFLEARALDFVDHYLSITDLDLCENAESRNSNRIKSPASLGSKGAQSLARRVNFGSIGGGSVNFDWTGEQNENSGHTLRKTDDLLFDLGGDKSGASSIHEESVIVGLQKTSFHLQSKEKQKGNISTLNNLGTKSMDPSEFDRIVSNSAKHAEYNFIELDEEFGAGQLEQQVQKIGNAMDASDIFDVGFDTQMAAEAMQALTSALPPSSYPDFSCQDFDVKFVNSSEGAKKKHKSKDFSYLGNAILGSANKGKQKKPVKRSARGQKGSGSQSLLKENMMVKKPLAEKDINSRNSGNRKTSKCGRVHTSAAQEKEDGFTEKDNFKSVDKKKVIVESNGCTSDGQCSKDKVSNPSHAARGTGHYLLVTSSEKAEASNYCSEERTSDTTISVAPLKRRKMISFNEDICKIGGKGKRSNLDFACFQDPTNPLNQENRSNQVRPDKGPPELSPWIYPRRRRTRRNPPCHSNNNQPPPSMVVHEKNENTCHTVNQKICMKTGNLAYSHEFQFSPGSSRQNISKWNYLEINNSESASTDVQVLVIVDRSIMSEQSGKLDSDFSTPSTHTSGIRKLDAFTNGNSESLKVYQRVKKSKQPCHNPSRSALVKELARLGYAESQPDFLAKDSRRRRIASKACVLFSQNLDANIIKQQRRIVARLGFSIASCCSEATHFVTDKFVRSRNMLEAIALGKPVVTHLWLDSCGQAGYFIDEKRYILRDDKKEKEIGFSMPVSLTRACQLPLLEGRRVFITPNVKPSIDVICSLVEAVHGQVVEEIQSSKRKGCSVPDDLLILSCQEDYKICVPFLKKGASIFSSELLLTGIIIQKLEYERHHLFEDFPRTRNVIYSPRRQSICAAT